MMGENILKRILALFVAVALIYIAGFYGIESMRGRQGPWQVTFITGAAGEPSLAVTEPKLKITNVTCAFPGQRTGLTNFAQTIIFDRPVTNVPFGKVVYLDTTFLPGAVVFEMFGHEVQLLPRVLMLDRAEIPWQSGSRLELP